MKNKHIRLYMDLATRISNESYSDELKVGCLIVRDENIISIGWNGTPNGYDNTIKNIDGSDSSFYFHAEENAIYKLARTYGNADKATMFVTHAPCFRCSKAIYRSGIKEIWYQFDYKTNEGLTFLKNGDCIVNKYTFA